MGRWFALEPHLGRLILQSRQQVWTPVGELSDNRHEVGLAAGLGPLIRPTRHLYLGGSVDCWGGGVHCDVLPYTAQIEYHFGGGSVGGAGGANSDSRRDDTCRA